jgi:hypothetical protein
MWPHPAGGEKQRKSCYHHKTAMVAGYDRLLFQPLMRQIRCSADQWNFFADQRILRALTIQ